MTKERIPTDKKITHNNETKQGKCYIATHCTVFSVVLLKYQYEVFIVRGI